METKLLTQAELEELCGGPDEFSIRFNGCGGKEVVLPLFGEALPDFNLVFSQRMPTSVGDFTDNRIPCSLFSAFPPFSNGYSRLKWRITVDNLIQGSYNKETEEFYVTAQKPTHTLLVMRCTEGPSDGKNGKINGVINPKFCEWSRTGLSEDGQAFVSYIMFRHR